MQTAGMENQCYICTIFLAVVNGYKLIIFGRTESRVGRNRASLHRQGRKGSFRSITVTWTVATCSNRFLVQL